MTRTLTLTRPDDWHLHVRDGGHLASVLPFTARQFARAIIMPNLKPPVTTVAVAGAYRERIVPAPRADAGEQPFQAHGRPELGRLHGEERVRLVLVARERAVVHGSQGRRQ